MKSSAATAVVLRTARPSDRKRIISLIDRVAGERRYLQTIRYEPTPAWERLLRAGSDPKTGGWLGVLVYGREIIGMGRLFADATHSPLRPTGNLGLALAPAWRARGLGTMLLAKLIDIAAKLGYFYVRADILTTNDRSIKLFQKFGFQITDLYETYWLAGELWVDEVTVERSTKLAVPLHIKPHLTDKSRFEPVR